MLLLPAGNFENPIPGQEWGWADETLLSISVNHKEKRSVKAIAKEAQLIIEGHWRLTCPPPITSKVEKGQRMDI